MRKSAAAIVAVLAALLAGCGDHQKQAGDQTPHLHVDVPPHGGTPVALGDEYQIEWVLDSSAGRLQAYFLDGEMENFVRISPPSFDLHVKLPDRQEILHFQATANVATGEKVGSTSLFEAQADWLKTNKTFDAVLPEINVEGTVYSTISFNFPKGAENKENTAASEVRGEPIEPVAATESATNSTEAENGLAKRKHPKPASTQRRMVMTEFMQLTQTNDLSGAMPSGTKGTAADLAKTNLPSLTSFAGAAQKIPGYADVTFEQLAGFDFVLSGEMADGTGNPQDIATKAKAQIPSALLALDGRKVVVEGFLLPVKMNDSLAVEFLLMRNQSMCCYGVPPKVNEWITVQLSGKGVEPVMDRPIAVAGVLHVGPIEENGCLAGIYRLDGEKVLTSF